MAESDRRHGRVRRLLLALVLLAVVGVGGAAVVYRTTDRFDDDIIGARDTARDRLDELLGDDRPTAPEAIAPPEGLDLPELTPAPPVATPVSSATTTLEGAVRRAMAPALRDPKLGRHVLALVTDLATGAEVFRQGDGAAIPASTTKLLTATAALQAVGPETRFTTKVVAGGPGTVVLVGGGDPFLEREPETPGADDGPSYPARADLTTLAQQTAAALVAAGTTTVQVGYDDSLFTGPAVNPAWPVDYISDGVVSPITALWADEGRPAQCCGRVADPSLAAAQDFTAALQASGITVTAPPARGVAAASGQVLASVQSAPLREIVQRVLEASDNEAAEVLARQVAIARGLPGSSAEAAAAVLATLGELGVPTTGIAVHDGSGLSRRNRIEPAALTAVLRVAADPARPRLQTLLPALPVAGFTGSLADRFAAADPAGRGVVRAKTGTLEGVGSLAGIAVDATGHPYLFALMADKVGRLDELPAEAALDAAAAALGACVCSQ